MEDSGGSVSPPEYPPSLFHCRLDQQPNHLVPEYALVAAQVRAEDLVLHPDCVFTHDRELPTAFDEQPSLVEKLAMRGTVAWIPHPATHALQPYWLSRESHEKLEGVRSGKYSASEIPSLVRDALTMAGVLVDPRHAQAQRSSWEKQIARAAAQFQERGFAPISGLIHPFHVAALRRYYRQRIRTGGMVLGDGQSARRYVAHNDGVARFFHHLLAPAMAAVAGEPVKPSYVYVASYQGGAKLERHTDRLQCEFSMTFCLDYSPEPALATPWPLQLHTKTGLVTVYQAIGDALLYRGRALPHSRDTLRQGQTSTSIFFHYVRQDFSGQLD